MRVSLVELATGTVRLESIWEMSDYAELQIVRRDEALEEAGVHKVDLIKMDIEGQEKLALEGLESTLPTSRPIVVMELTVTPNASHCFQNRAELVRVFPPRSAFLAFDESDLAGGTYRLKEFTVTEGARTKSNVIAYPL